MTARKCKVCGRDLPTSPVAEWCRDCADEWAYRVEHSRAKYSTTAAAEWGAKRRADAARKGEKR